MTIRPHASRRSLLGCARSLPSPAARPRRRRRWSCPAAFTPLGLSAPYLLGDVIGGQQGARGEDARGQDPAARAPADVGAYMADLDAELRRQTAGIGLDVLQVGDSIVIRIPAAFTFDPEARR